MERKIKIFKHSTWLHGSSQKSFRNSHVDGESSDGEKSVDEESKVPLVTILGTWIAKKTLKTHDNNNGIQIST
jgi:hypothetical protein